jgi:hypothetical protein
MLEAAYLLSPWADGRFRTDCRDSRLPEGKKQSRGIAMTRVRILFILIVVVLFGSACTDTGTAPPSPPTEGPSSHDWTWEYTIIDPENTSGWLWDVCYINDTCIWAVGKIQHHGDWYNACRWNGNEWVLEKVYDDRPSSTERGVHELNTVYGKSADNIWFSKGSVFIHWNGNDYVSDRSLVNLVQGSVFESWGNSSDNIYMGGTNGEIVHYNGHYWKRLENEIEWDIGAMHGNGDTVLVAATGPSKSGKTAFYTIVNEEISFFSQDSLPHGVQALWYSHLGDIYTDGPHSFHFDGREWQQTVDWKKLLPSGYGNDMAANNRYDILVVGALSTIRHYNSIDWQKWCKLPGLEDAYFNACTMRGDEAWVVGLITEGTEVVIVKGTRSAK